MSPVLWAGVSLLPFLVLLVAVLSADLAPLGMDRWWADVMAGLHGPVITSVQTFVSDLGGGLVGGLLVPAGVLVVVWRVRSVRDAVTFAAAILCSVAAVQVVKHVVARPRPSGQMLATDFGSFPSGHVANAATLTVVLALLIRRRWLVAAAVIWPLLMAVSRTYLSVHWLSDTIAGASVGACVAVVVVALARWQEHRTTRTPLASTDAAEPGERSDAGPVADDPAVTSVRVGSLTVVPSQGCRA